MALGETRMPPHHYPPHACAVTPLPGACEALEATPLGALRGQGRAGGPILWCLLCNNGERCHPLLLVEMEEKYHSAAGGECTHPSLAMLYLG